VRDAAERISLASSGVVNLAAYRLRIRQRLRESAVALLRTTTRGSVSVTTVCDHAGVSARAFNAHYASAEQFAGDLASTLIDERAAHLHANLATSSTSPGGPHQIDSASLTELFSLECDTRGTVLFLYEAQIGALGLAAQNHVLHNGQRTITGAVELALRRLDAPNGRLSRGVVSTDARMVASVWAEGLVRGALSGAAAIALRRGAAAEVARYLSAGAEVRYSVLPQLAAHYDRRSAAPRDPSSRSI